MEEKKPIRTSNYMCDLCTAEPMYFRYSHSLREHLTKAHSVKLDVFDNYDSPGFTHAQFEEWLDEVCEDGYRYNEISGKWREVDFKHVEGREKSFRCAFSPYSGCEKDGRVSTKPKFCCSSEITATLVKNENDEVRIFVKHYRDHNSHAHMIAAPRNPQVEGRLARMSIGVKASVTNQIIRMTTSLPGAKHLKEEVMRDVTAAIQALQYMEMRKDKLSGVAMSRLHGVLKELLDLAAAEVGYRGEEVPEGLDPALKRRRLMK